MISILSTSPYSIIKVASTLANTLKATYHRGFFNPKSLSKNVIIIGNPDYYLTWLIQSIKNRNIIIYTVCEGKLINKSFIYPHLKDKIIITPSKYVKTKLEEIDIHVSEIIPHAITTFTKPKTTNNHEMIYISGYQKRKYPEYGIKALTLAGYKPYAITTLTNPYKNHFRILAEAYRLSDEEIHNTYEKFSYYLNLSDNEGFGLTPLEAMGHGLVVITAKIPSIMEYINDATPFLVELTGNITYEQFSFELIEHFEYDYKQMSEYIIKALTMNNNEYENWSKKAFETAKKYNPQIYKKFLEFTINQ
jgi:glycosyltransferase involved in cell wall biosynthesis